MNNIATNTKQRRSRQQWQGTLDLWQKSGQLPSEFCRVNSISLASFYQWRLKLHAEASEDRANHNAIFTEYRHSALATSCPLKINVTWDWERGIQIRITGDWAWNSCRGEHGDL